MLRIVFAALSKYLFVLQRIKNATAEAESNKTKLETERAKIYYKNSKFSNISVIDTGPNFTVATMYEVPQNLNFEEMTLSRDQHFSNVLVNTNYSSVHVPTNIYDRCK